MNPEIVNTICDAIVAVVGIIVVGIVLYQIFKSTNL